MPRGSFELVTAFSQYIIPVLHLQNNSYSRLEKTLYHYMYYTNVLDETSTDKYVHKKEKEKKTYNQNA
jgi:hypothetical protein